MSLRQLNWSATGVCVSIPFSSFPFTKLPFVKFDITMNEKLKEYVTDYLDIFVAKGHSIMSKGNNNKEYPNLY